MGLSAILFIALLRGFNPLLFQPSTGYLPDSGTSSRMFSREKIEKRFLPGFIQGAFFSGGMILAFVLGGTYRYWGFFIQFAEAPLELANVLFRMTALIALAYCEEFIFREKIPQLFLQHPNLSRNLLERPNESPTVNKALPDIAMIHFIALAYCGVKMIQFDIGIMHLITLYLVSIALSLRTQIDGQFTRAAGFWAAILVTFHPMLSLPLFGNDFSGILLIKYQASLNSSSSPGSMARILSGGAGGPLASFTFQLLMILDIVRSLYKRRKITLLERPS